MELLADKAEAIRDKKSVYSVMGLFDRPNLSGFESEVMVVLIIYLALSIVLNMVLIFGIRSQVRACFLPWLIAEIPLILFLVCVIPLIYLGAADFSSEIPSTRNYEGWEMYLSVPAVLMSVIFGLVASFSWVLGFRLWRQMGRKVSDNSLIRLDATNAD